jgi:hypothetical protein
VFSSRFGGRDGGCRDVFFPTARRQLLYDEVYCVDVFDGIGEEERERERKREKERERERVCVVCVAFLLLNSFL